MRRTTLTGPLGILLGMAMGVALALGPLAALPPAGAAPAHGSPASANTAQGGSDPTVWLCRPGMHRNPCVSSLTTTVVRPRGRNRVVHARPASNPPIDCFYIYPTVSEQQSVLSNLTVDPQETAVAKAQASRFSQVCRVYAPMYRQITDYGLEHLSQLKPQDLQTAYDDVQAAWQYYLAHYNHGRGVVVIGHSQGASMAIRLLRNQVDNKPSVRKRLVSAIILGGNVTVPVGKTVGGSFQHIPACRSLRQTGCVVAYSSFDQSPPSDSLFGRPGQGVSFLSGVPAGKNQQVLCVNPAALRGGSGVLQPFFPTSSVAAAIGGAKDAPNLPTPWVTEPLLYSARCESQGGATWLQVNDIARRGDHRPIVQQTLGPTWGLHLVDVNIALGNLVAMVHSQAIAYRNR